MNIKNRAHILEIIKTCIKEGQELEKELQKARYAYIEKECRKLNMDPGKIKDEAEYHILQSIDSGFDEYYEEERNKWLRDVIKSLRTIEILKDKKILDHRHFDINEFLEDLYTLSEIIEKNKTSKLTKIGRATMGTLILRWDGYSIFKANDPNCRAIIRTGLLKEILTTCFDDPENPKRHLDVTKLKTCPRQQVKGRINNIVKNWAKKFKSAQELTKELVIYKDGEVLISENIKFRGYNR